MAGEKETSWSAEIVRAFPRWLFACLGFCVLALLALVILVIIRVMFFNRPVQFGPSVFGVADPQHQQVPSGTVMAYAGERSEETLEKQGWLICRGQELEVEKYPALAESVGRAWGHSNDARKFLLPDLRSVFLRGVDHERGGTFGDEIASRIPNGNNAKDAVGSFELDATKLPNNPFGVSVNGAADVTLRSTWDQDFLARGLNGDHPFTLGGTVAGGDRETRPKNASVEWIIKI